MRDVMEAVRRWRADGRRVALATVVNVWGSAPRRPGSKMAVSSAGDIAGSVSGGCVESAVVEEALGVLESGRPRLVRFGVTNERAWEVGLTCGGTIEIFVEELEERREPVATLERSLAEERLVVQATIVAGPGAGEQMLLWPSGETLGGLGAPEADACAREEGRAALADLASRRTKVALPAGEADVFLEVHAPRPRLIVVGAVHVAIPLVHIARLLGFNTVVVDPRPAFATAERFGHADELVVDWPREALARIGLHETTYVAVLAHDLKIEVPALAAALASPARYVGVLGSRKTHARRVAALREAGVGEESIGRLHAPIGLDLGAERPEEIAVSIAAEIIAAGHGRV